MNTSPPQTAPAKFRCNAAVIARILGAFMVASLFVFLIDNYLIYWLELPGLRGFLEYIGWIESAKPVELSTAQSAAMWIEAIVCILLALIIVLYCSFSAGTLEQDGAFYSSIAAFIVRGAFWSIFLIGLADMLISFLRVEGFLNTIVGEEMGTQLGRPIFRGSWVHYPLVIAGFVIAFFNRSLGFVWLALLIVVAEFSIVVTRFVFSYEQAFMGDLVRFWYAGLFLFASAYTLVEDGHVRVDVLYTNFSERGKAIANIVGSLLLGLPLCWNILIQGMSGKGSIINSPILSFEISQSGFGMYTKYLMAGYLIIFAVSMGVQFVGFTLQNLAVFMRKEESPDKSNEQTVTA